jgi:hypothetical protein
LYSPGQHKKITGRLQPTPTFWNIIFKVCQQTL